MKRFRPRAKGRAAGIKKPFSRVTIILEEKETKDKKKDFSLGIKHFFDIADYITVNISSPNTEGLRDFHDQQKLVDLIVSLNKIKRFIFQVIIYNCF